ncbi:Spermine synthase [Anaeromyxobacter sp. K]|uniref:fused MFS/spermidine synthase n=1 Tax=Anaeromyxobacter sp. (strain K) TaxID=447217 RepID=UPI00017BE2C5|nr:fused MFS/spermidine synthase [Anaeromyxobacter sp. K]ACG73886.1 Spermine synthase [Anaeromyxobacter sp. K]
MRGFRRDGGVYALFFVSGAAGLVYQVAWSRLLNEIFGVTAHAVTAVLATFLGGLALGSWLLGRAADRCRDPLRLYALLELGVAATAIAGTAVVRALDPVHLWAASRLAPDSLGLLLVRAGLAAVVVLPPTVLMGGTLPAITRALVRRIGHLGRELSFVYALNTAGAVAGSVAAGFALIRALGVHGTLWAAAAANVAVGLGALAFSRARGAAGAAPPAVEAPVTAPAAGAATGTGWILAVMALSGVSSLALEVIWTRMLILIVGTSTYAFVTMLTAFLVGIALGSFVARAFVDRVRSPRRAFGWVQAGIAASTLATLPLMGALMGDAQRWIDGLELRWEALLAGRFGLSFLVMIVPTTLIGMTFPLAARIWARSLDTLGGRLGQLYGANTLGNIAGAVLGGFVVLPAVGMQRGVALMAVLNLIGAAWALLPAREDHRRPAVLLRAAPVSAGLWACALLVALWRPAPFGAAEEGPDDPVLFYREGLVSTVKVIQRADDGRQRVMLVDGVRIGQSSEGVDRKQQVLAHFPILLRDRPPARVLTIGLGTGILAGEVARHPGVERVDVVELSPSVIEGARLFDRFNGAVLDDPRVRVVNDDGVAFLRRSAERYDAIISDGKSRSGHAGNAQFYSQDYYRSARAHLAPGGVMMQWVPLDVPAADLRVILRTFEEAFPDTYVWIAQSSCFLVGLDGPLALDLARVQRVLDAPESDDLRRHGWRTAAEVVALLAADRETLAPWLALEDTVNTLERPVLEFYAPAELAVPPGVRAAANLATLGTLSRGIPPTARVTGGDAAALADGARAERLLVDGVAALGRGDAAGIARLEAAAQAAPADGVIRQAVAEALVQLGVDADRSSDLARAEVLYRAAIAAWPRFATAWVNLGRALALEGRLPEALAAERRALDLNPESGSAHRWAAELLLGVGRPGEATDHAREAVRLAPGAARLRAALGTSLAMSGRFDEGLRELREAVRLDPRAPEPLGRTALLLATRPGATGADAEEAVRLASRARSLTDGRDPAALETLAAAYAAAGRFGDAVAEQGRAVELLDRAGAAQAGDARATLARYRSGQPLRLDAPAAP